MMSVVGRGVQASQLRLHAQRHALVELLVANHAAVVGSQELKEVWTAALQVLEGHLGRWADFRAVGRLGEERRRQVAVPQGRLLGFLPPDVLHGAEESRQALALQVGLDSVPFRQDFVLQRALLGHGGALSFYRRLCSICRRYDAGAAFDLLLKVLPVVDLPLGLHRLVQSQLDVAGGRVYEAQEVPGGLLEVLVLLRLAEEAPVQTFLHVELHHRPGEAETHELGVHDCRLNSH